MNVEELEIEAKATAAKHVSNILQRPDQLDKVDQYKRRVIRKKASVEAMLKTALQSQLDGVRTGLTQLGTSWQDIQVLKSSFAEIEDQFEMVPKLKVKLHDVREESLKHSQYAAAMENLKHIFTVPESVERTWTWIKNKKYLEAHQSLTDLENSRDDLLFELHKLPNQSPTDRNMLKQYFADVKKLSDALGEELWSVLSQCLVYAVEEPTTLVTAMRIIEREEKSDKMCEDRFKQTGYTPSDRPKRWRQMALNVLENAQLRIATVPITERADDKMWLVVHLETLRLRIIDDLKTVKRMCTPCFPPHYHIFEKFVEMYHSNLSKRLLELTKRLEENEYASLLSWVNTYAGPELMGHPDLNIDVSTLSPLLSNEAIQNLIDCYCSTIKSNFSSWMENTLRSDFQDWLKEVEPESTSEGYYHTPVPVILFQMIDQHLQLVKTVNNELVSRVMDLSMKEVLLFCSMYRELIIKFKIQHFKDRNVLKCFTQYMIAIINNCLQFVDLANQLRRTYCKAPDPTAIYSNSEADATSLNVLKAFYNLRDEAISILLDEMFLDLEPHLQGLFTKKWFGSPIIVDTICVTLEDYCSDYTCLSKKNFAEAIKCAQDRVAVNYIKAMLQRRMVLRNYEERKEFAEQVIKEADKLKDLFNILGRSQITVESPFEALPMMVEVVKLKDPNMVSLEIMGFKKRYEDVNVDQLTALLILRGDINKNDARQLVIDVLPKEAVDHRPSNPSTSIFSQITIQM